MARYKHPSRKKRLAKLGRLCGLFSKSTAQGEESIPAGIPQPSEPGEEQKQERKLKVYLTNNKKKERV